MQDPSPIDGSTAAELPLPDRAPTLAQALVAHVVQTRRTFAHDRAYRAALAIHEALVTEYARTLQAMEWDPAHFARVCRALNAAWERACALAAS